MNKAKERKNRKINGRKQYSEIIKLDKNVSFSSYRQIYKNNNFGVPQDSILRLSLLLLYINNLLKITNNKFQLFLDVISITISHKYDVKNSEDKITETVQKIVNWIQNNKLKVNSEIIQR